MLQARMSENDPRFYSPTRDVAHNFQYVVREAAARLEDGRWRQLHELLGGSGLTEEQLAVALDRFCVFVDRSVQDKRMTDSLLISGFADVPDAAQIALMATIGAIMSGIYWSGVHEATIGGQGPAQTYGDLREVGRRCYLLVTMPRWRRRWLMLTTRVREFLNALRHIWGRDAVKAAMYMREVKRQGESCTQSFSFPIASEAGISAINSSKPTSGPS